MSLAKAPIVLTVLALIMVGVAMAMPLWLVGDSGGSTLSKGLWKTCNDASTSFSSCVGIKASDLGTTTTKLRVVRAFMIIALCALFLGLVSGVLFTFDRTQAFLTLVAAGFDVIGMISLAVAVGVFVKIAYDADATSDLYASFILAVIAMVISLVSGLMFCIVKCMNKPNKVV